MSDETKISGYEWSMTCGECGGELANDGGPLERWEGEHYELEHPDYNDRIGSITDGTDVACAFCAAEWSVSIERTDE